MKTIVVAANKGGVGKTTSTLSLAAGLEKKGYRILLIDTDPQANLSLVMGCAGEEKDRIGCNVASWLLGMREFSEVKVEKQGIDLIASADRWLVWKSRSLPISIPTFYSAKPLSPFLMPMTMPD
jgi:chromosome partitioning protein